MKLKTLTIFTVAGLALVGCAVPREVSSFEPYDGQNNQQMFKYSAFARDANNAQDEKERLDTLTLWLQKSDYCPNGYKIISRKVAWWGGNFDSLKKIYYVGVCN